MYLVSTKATQVYSDVDYSDKQEVFLLFGKETKGLPESLLKSNLEEFSEKYHVAIIIPDVQDTYYLNQTWNDCYTADPPM